MHFFLRYAPPNDRKHFYLVANLILFGQKSFLKVECACKLGQRLRSENSGPAGLRYSGLRPRIFVLNTLRLMIDSIFIWSKILCQGQKQLPRLKALVIGRALVRVEIFWQRSKEKGLLYLVEKLLSRSKTWRSVELAGTPALQASVSGLRPRIIFLNTLRLISTALLFG